jgi:curved DNA-binding protein CbpA
MGRVRFWGGSADILYRLMSAPLAGKFQDHYEILGIDPKSDSDTIQKAYSKLAQKYYPSSVTANAEMFEAVNMAYETLSNPELRAIFDKLKGVGQEDGPPKFSGADFFDALGREGIRRAAILCVLYDRRLSKPSQPSLSMRHLELIVEATPIELSLALWYLKQRGLAVSDDKSSLQITADGMDFLEDMKPLPEDVMPFIKQAATAAPPTQPKRVEQSVLTTLNRALTRTSA